MADYIKNKTWGKHQIALFGLLVFAILLVGAVYVYCVSSIVMETVNRDHNIQNLQIIQREHQELEKTYLSLLVKFNLDYVYSLGFVSNGNALSFLTREIKVAQNSAENLAR